MFKARATGLDAASKTLFINEGDVSYDMIVIATGMTHSYFGRDDWEKLAPGLKTIPDALRIRARVLEAFEKAELEEDPFRRESLLTFVIVGAGPTGVELAGALGELAHRTLKDEYRRFDPTRAKIVLLDFADRILPTFDQRLSAKAEKSLEKLGVMVRSGAKVIQVTEESVMIESGGRTEEFSAENVFWAAGVEATDVAREFAKALNAETDAVGRIKVREDLSVPGHPDVFVIGDLAAFPDPLPGVAPVAMQMGKHLLKVIRAKKRGEAPPAFRYRDYGTLAVIGRNAAVADFGWLKLSGFAAWLIWAVVHIVQIIGFDNRLVIAAQWAYSLSDLQSRRAIDRGRGRRAVNCADQMQSRESNATETEDLWSTMNGEIQAVDSYKSFGVRTRVLGMKLAVGSLSAMFGALTVLYLLQLPRKLDYPFKAPNSLWVSTAMILLSSLAVWLGLRAIRAGDRRKLFVRISYTMLFGVLFLASQGFAWSGLVKAQVFAPTNPVRDLFYVLTGVHGAHVLAGIVWLGVVVRKAYRGGYSKSAHLGVELFSLYWHFMAIVWIFFFVMLVFL